GHVGRHVSEGPGLGWRSVRSALGALVDEDQTVSPAGERIEIVAELVMVETRPTVQDEDRVTGLWSTLHHEQAGVAGVYQPTLAVHVDHPFAGGVPQASLPVRAMPPVVIP